MPPQVVSYLGPEETYSHGVARRRFPAQGAVLVPCPDIRRVFDHVISRESRYGIVPIENSSGGTIEPTLDVLVDPDFPLAQIAILEQLSLDVKLALLARPDADAIGKIYSHPAPLAHCRDWLRARFPDAELCQTASTAAAAAQASREKGTAAIANVTAAEKHGLAVLHHPVAPEDLNVTQFFLLGGREDRSARCAKTSMTIEVEDRVGGLADLLQCFAGQGVNLTRIVSRVVRGRPGKYVFLIEINGAPGAAKVDAALKAAEAASDSLRNLGSYPVARTYSS